MENKNWPSLSSFYWYYWYYSFLYISNQYLNKDSELQVCVSYEWRQKDKVVGTHKFLFWGMFKKRAKSKGKRRRNGHQTLVLNNRPWAGSLCHTGYRLLRQLQEESQHPCHPEQHALWQLKWDCGVFQNVYCRGVGKGSETFDLC